MVHFEDVEVGSGIPALTKHPDATLLVKWACTANDFYPIHFDKDFAQSQGLPDVIVHGDLMFSFLARMLVTWVGEQGVIKQMLAEYRRIVLPNQDITCKGKVVRKYRSDNEDAIECEIWIEDQKGEKLVIGSSIVNLPNRKSPVIP